MKKLKTVFKKIVITSFLAVMIFGFQSIIAQDENEPITVYQFRRVEQANMDELIERETKYWSKVAQKDIDDGKRTFWAFLVKVGGVDLEHSANVLMIDTFTDLDDMEGVGNASAVFPDVPMEDMRTGSLVTATSSIFVLNRSFILKESENPMEDFRYVNMVYHTADAPGALITAENEIWGPFIKSAWENGKVNQTGWGNAIILSPTGGKVSYNTVSFDIYPSLKEALNPTWAEDIEIPDMTRIGEAEGNNRRATEVYRIVMSLMAE